MTRALAWFAALAVAATLGALAVSFSGLISIAASSGHFEPIRWFLGWSLRNAVRTQSVPVGPPPDLDDPALVLRAAGHYDTGCAVCHGAPGVPQSPVILGMTPQPPRLEQAAGHWDDDELFWIVKHGIKYSGMPAWPAQSRDDEVWAQVAFLRALSDMTPHRYAALALGAGDAGEGDTGNAAGGAPFERALADCARCHGRDGLGRGEGAALGAFPVVAGQPAEYLFATLQAFASGARKSGFMEAAAARHPEAVLRALAQHYAAQPAPVARASGEGGAPADDPGRGTADAAAGESRPLQAQDEAGRLDGDVFGASLPVPSATAKGPPRSKEARLALGRRIALHGLPGEKTPACRSCHGAAGRARNPLFPTLDGQREWYLAGHLRLWKDGGRGGTPYAGIMADVAERMTEQQIDAVAAWYSGR